MTLQIPKRLATFQQMQRSDALTQLLNHFTAKPLAPSYAEYLRLNKALNSGDAAMDAVVHWVMQNPKRNRPLFETALFQGLAQLPESIPELDRFLPAYSAQARLAG